MEINKLPSYQEVIESLNKKKRTKHFILQKLDKTLLLQRTGWTSEQLGILSLLCFIWAGQTSPAFGC
jgi:hypothetical protein